MKKILLLALSSCFALGTFAQRIVPKMIEDGFYRAQSYATKRYAYLLDNTGSLDVTINMGAVVLYNEDYHDRFSDPASVLYVSNVENWNLGWKNDLESQNTGFYDIIKHFIKLELPNPNSTPKLYQLHETSTNAYLGDPVISKAMKKSYLEQLDKNNMGDEQYWQLFPVSPVGDNYLGIAVDSNMKVGDKYYKPYILGFAMSFYSPGMKAYYVSDVKRDAIVIKEVQENIIPENTPIIVECSATEASDNRVDLYYKSPKTFDDNKLSGQYFCYGSHGPTAYKVYDATTMRLMTVKDGRLVFYTPSADDESRTTTLTINNVKYPCLNANEAYLVVPADFPAEVPVITYEEYGASHPYEVYDINIDGKIDLQDLQCIKDMMLQKATKWTRADVNGDGRYSIGDVTSYVKFLMNRK